VDNIVKEIFLNAWYFCLCWCFAAKNASHARFLPCWIATRDYRACSQGLKWKFNESLFLDLSKWISHIYSLLAQWLEIRMSVQNSEGCGFDSRQGFSHFLWVHACALAWRTSISRLLIL
jgi:hypothetical protein